MFVSSIVLLFSSFALAEDFCSSVSNCNGNGFCNTVKNICECYNGFGSNEELLSGELISSIAFDCSERTCPRGEAWADYKHLNDENGSAIFFNKRECSNVGSCDRTQGTCTCYNGFWGSACGKRGCKSSATDIPCNNNGRCFSLRELSREPAAQPLTTETLDPDNQALELDHLFGCLCHSGWDVGLESGKTQVPEYFGPTCSQKRCPSADDPMTIENETDCENKFQDSVTLEVNSAIGVGKAGNLCHVDCANRGICDYSTGICACFTGYSGKACEQQDALALGL